MKNIKLSLVALVLTLTALWLLADTLVPQPLTYFSFRAVFVQYTGIIGIGAMSVAMVLASRPKWLERHLHGLDKMYRLHKWLGITGLAVAIVHWWWALGTKWMVGWGWLTRPARKPRTGETLGLVEQWLRSQRGLAESVGEWPFYAIAILLALALIKRFPYRLFAKTHTWIAALYLVMVYHATVLIKFDYWSRPVGWVVAVLMLRGAVAALLVLSRRVGVRRRVPGVVESVNYYPGVHVVEASIRLRDGWDGHDAGQFAFMTVGRNEGAHPYTIASAWDAQERRIVFIIKELGDHTNSLREQLKAGVEVTVEGPYGCFDFHDRHVRQIWVGAGIGITPFIARMKQLARTPGRQAIDLFHATRDFEQAAIDKLTADAKAANIRLHVLVDAKDGLLTADRIRSAVPDWRAASLWFCGPSGFGTALRDDFATHGLPTKDFHQEWFQLR